MKRFLVPLIAALFLLPALACGSTTGSGNGATKGQTYTQGQTASIKNWDVTLVAVEHPGKELVWSSFGNKSTAAGEWLVATVKLKNTGTQNFGVNTFDFELQGNGTTYKVSTDAAAYGYADYKKTQQIGGQVPPGVEVTYYVIFDIAPGSSGLALLFKQDKQPRFTLP